MHRRSCAGNKLDKVIKKGLFIDMRNKNNMTTLNTGNLQKDVRFQIHQGNSFTEDNLCVFLDEVTYVFKYVYIFREQNKKISGIRP